MAKEDPRITLPLSVLGSAIGVIFGFGISWGQAIFKLDDVLARVLTMERIAHDVQQTTTKLLEENRALERRMSALELRVYTAAPGGPR